MRALIDADILIYEIGFSSETYETAAENGQILKDKVVVSRSWEFVEDLLNKRINSICEEVGATEPPLLFLTNTGYINKVLNKKRKYNEEPLVEFVPNFREKLAITKGYKEGRATQKPYHFKNITNYLLANFDCIVNEKGLEADDAMAIYHFNKMDEGKPTIICSRDKDLRQIPGWYYSWECGKQNSIGPMLIDNLGKLWNKNEGKFNPKTNKPMPLMVLGTGSLFFYYQMLAGDDVDNIVGVIGKGKTFAYNLLKNCKSEQEAYELTVEVYVKSFGDGWETKWDEMSALLWIVRELNEDGSAKRWKKTN